MNTKELKQVLEARGYVVHSEYSKYNNIFTVYNYNGEEVGKCHRNTIERIAAGDSCIKKWNDYSEYYAHYLCQKYVDFENRDHCRRIANELETYTNGTVYKCPECGREFDWPEDAEKYHCPECDFEGDVDEYEDQSIYDYFSDCLDIEYRCNSSKEFKSVSVCVAWGGPSIYIDTSSGDVELYWWGERARWPMSEDVIGAVDDWAEEYFKCM